MSAHLIVRMRVAMAGEGIRHKPKEGRPFAGTTLFLKESEELLHEHDVVGADCLAAIRVGALGCLSNEPVDIPIDGFDDIPPGVTAGVLEEGFYFAAHHQNLLRLFGSSLLFCFRHGSTSEEERVFVFLLCLFKWRSKPESRLLRGLGGF
jgi:hypothetical protein